MTLYGVARVSLIKNVRSLEENEGVDHVAI